MLHRAKALSRGGTFHEAQVRGTCVNKMYAVTHERVFNATSFSVDTPLNTVVSEVGIRFFYEDGTDMLQKLVHAGIMEVLENVKKDTRTLVDSVAWPHQGQRPRNAPSRASLTSCPRQWTGERTEASQRRNETRIRETHLRE